MMAQERRRVKTKKAAVCSLGLLAWIGFLLVRDSAISRSNDSRIDNLLHDVNLGFNTMPTAFRFVHTYG
jgi:hypothetical protein